MVVKCTVGTAITTHRLGEKMFLKFQIYNTLEVGKGKGVDDVVDSAYSIRCNGTARDPVASFSNDLLQQWHIVQNF